MPDYHVTPNADGSWSAQRENASRASSNHDTQREAIDAARGYTANAGGGELNIHGRNGEIRAKDTIAPGNDSRNIKG